MLRRFTLKTRLNLLIAAILAGIVALGGFLVIHHVRGSVAEETESALQLAREAVEVTRLQAPLPESRVNEWVEMLERSNRLRHVRLLISQEPGEVRREPGPESVQGVPAWFVQLVKPSSMRDEQLIPIHPDGGLQVILVADPGAEIAEAWQETKVFLGLIALLAAGFFIAVAIVLGQAFLPVDTILQGLLALERGDYHWRLPNFPQPEFDRIAAAFNHLACVLEQTRADNRSLTCQLLKVEEEERRLLARELHDELGQVLGAIKVMALSVQKLSPSEPVIRAAQIITEQVDHLFKITRSMIQKLRPLMLDDLGLAAAIDTLVSSWREKQADTRLQLSCDETIDEFPRDGQIHVYRIVQECLTNAFKHAQAQEIRLSLGLEISDVPSRRWLRIQVSDDGRGAALERVHGCGLRGIRERVESLDGRFEIATELGSGFTVSVWLPFEEEQDANAHSRHARR